MTRYGYNTAALPRLGDGVVRQVSILNAYSELIAVSLARAEFLGALLAQQHGDADADAENRGWDDGVAPDPGVAPGLIGHTFAASVIQDGRDQSHLERVATGEEIRALVKLEADERDRAASLLKEAVRMGVEIHAVEARRTYGSTVAATIQAFVRELGIDENSQEVSRAAERAVYAARRALGQDEGDPDVEAGPPLTAAERARAIAPVRR